MVKNLPVMQETQVKTLKKVMATHPSILTWRIPRTEEPVRLQTMVSQELATVPWGRKSWT